MGLTIIEFAGEWVNASFPASHSYVGKFTIQTMQSVTTSEERDIYRHLVDQNAAGRWVFIPDGLSDEEANSFQLSPTTAREASLQPKSGTSQSQKLRFLLGEIWEVLPGDKGTKENYYTERTQAWVKELSRELEDLQRLKKYGQV